MCVGAGVGEVLHHGPDPSRPLSVAGLEVVSLVDPTSSSNTLLEFLEDLGVTGDQRG